MRVSMTVTTAEEGTGTLGGNFPGIHQALQAARHRFTIRNKDVVTMVLLDDSRPLDDLVRTYIWLQEPGEDGSFQLVPKGHR